MPLPFVVVALVVGLWSLAWLLQSLLTGWLGVGLFFFCVDWWGDVLG
jgi:hypothetical protein